MAPGAATQGVIDQLFDLGGLGLMIMELGSDGPMHPSDGDPGRVRCGVHRGGPLPIVDVEAFDVLISSDPDAPAPWVGAGPNGLGHWLADLRTAIDRQPAAAAVAAQVLRMTLALTFDDALVLESLAYSMLLASEGFKAWRATTPVRVRGDAAQPRVRVEENCGTLHVVLTRPGARNAVDARMRDALVDALEGALANPSGGPVELSGEGEAFCAGGDLDEFGQADDAGLAHAIRTLRSPARLARRLGDRLTARLHGACIGAGIELPAAAGRVLAAPGAVFRLPEVSMGLIPGAGGTATIPRRIGRHRACAMAIGGRPLDAPTALAWGLVDGLDSPR